MISALTNAVSTASAADIDLIPELFFASFRYIPGADFVSSRSRNCSKADEEGNVWIGKSEGTGFVLMMVFED